MEAQVLQPEDQDRSPASVVTTAPVTGQSAPSDQVTPAITGGSNDQYSPLQPVEDQKQQFNSGEQAEQIKPSRWDKWSAGWDLQSNKSPVGLPGSSEGGAIPQWFQSRQEQELSDQNNAPVLSADQANKMYPGRPEPYSAPVSQWVAQMEYADRERIKKIQEWKNAGNETPGTDFAQSLLGGFADPLNAAIGVAVAPAKALLGVGSVEGFMAKFAARYAENLGVNAATGAVTYGVEKQRGLNPSVGDYIKQSAEGALGGTLFHTFLIDPLVRAYRGFVEENPATREQIVKEVIASQDRNTTPNLEAQQEVLEQRKTGAIQDGRNVRRSVPDVSNPTQYYAGLDSQGNKAVFEPGMGEGTQLHSNPDRVNNAVSNPEGAQPGRIGETTVPEDAKLLDLDKPLPKEIVDQAQAELRKAGVEDMVPRSALDQASGKDLLELMSQLPQQEDGYNASDALRARIEGEGYSGYTMMDKAQDGTPVGRIAHMFDENHPITGQEFEANPDVTPKITGEQQSNIDQQQSNKQESVYSDPETDKDVHDLRHGPVLNSTPEYMDQFAKDIEDQAKAELAKFAENSESAKAALDELKRLTADGKQQTAMAKALANCVESGLS